MNVKSSIIAAITLFVTSSSLPISPALAQVKKARFYCDIIENGNILSPATRVEISNKIGQDPWTIVVWKSEFGNMSPKQRCELVSSRFQSAFDRGDLKRLVAGVDRKTGQGLICAVSNRDSKCDLKHTLFAVQDKQKAQEVTLTLHHLLQLKPINPLSL
jgi:Circadian oscillating protein COP23